MRGSSAAHTFAQHRLVPGNPAKDKKEAQIRVFLSEEMISAVAVWRVSSALRNFPKTRVFQVVQDSIKPLND